MQDYGGYLYILPVLLGILLFTIVPMCTSLYYSFFDYKTYDVFPKNFGFQNYLKPFTSDWARFSSSISLTFSYAIVSVVLGIILSFALGMFLNQKIKGIKVFRVLYYTPVIIPAVVSGLLWSDMTNYEMGYFNLILTSLGFEKYGFYTFPETVFPTLIFMSLFTLGSNMVLWIAQIKSIPDTMYEAATLEGAGFFVKTFAITIPMCTPMIFYVLITSIISSLQVFSNVFVLITPGNQDALLFYVVNIYNVAFAEFDMGYACALSWILFLIIAGMTLVVFKTSKWVFYGEE